MEHRDSHQVSFTSDAAAFLRDAGDLLAAAPVTSTVVSTVAARAAASAERGEPLPTHPHWFATVRDGSGELVGVAMRTAPAPPHTGYLLAMPDAAATALADAVHARGEVMTTMNGALPAVELFLARLAGLRGGGTVVVDKHSRLFELGTLVPPAPVPGRLRAARAEEAPLLLTWFEAFHDDADRQAGRAPTGSLIERFDLDDVARRVAGGRCWVWVDDDDTPLHLTGANPPALGVARIGPVYTPAAHRGRGIASAAVAAVSAALRAQGARVCLFTDQANPTSNRIYQALGYERVVDQAELRIAHP